MESERGEGKRPLGLVKSFRNSVRRATGQTPPADNPAANADGTPTCPPSPSPSAASLVLSPLKNIGFFQRNDSNSPKTKGSNTDPNSGANSLLQRGASFRRNLFGSKREKKDVTAPINEELHEETKEAKEATVAEEEEKADEEQLEEMYSLPELPHTPLSVMQINKLIEHEVLEEAYLNLLALRLEFQSEASESGAGTIDLAKKEKDLNLLYNELKAKVCAIVRDSNSLPARNKKLLEFVARIVQEEERRASDPGRVAGSWMDFWKSAVQDGVRTKVEHVQLETRDQNPSWLAVHLGILGKAVVSDLEGVRRDLKWSYPPSFDAFGEYVRSYRRVLGRHVQNLETKTTELKDIHALLVWILHRYKSESVLGHVSLQVDMSNESTELDLEAGFISQLKDKFCCRVQEDLRSSLGKITSLEEREFWSERKEPETEEGVLISDMHMDIWTLVKSFVIQSRAIEVELEQRVTCSCLREITLFPTRFELAFRGQCDALRPLPVWTQYLITYVNSFSALLEHMEDYRESCPTEVESLSKEIKRFNVRLLQDLQDQFKENVKIPLRRMMTRKWLTTNEDFKNLQQRTEELCQHCTVLKEPHAQELASALHLHVSREYLAQLLKSDYSCKNKKHERAAAKIQEQWSQLQELFTSMDSCHDWLDPVGGALSDVIGQEHTSDIKNHLEPVVQLCPDFGRRHLSAVLWFRGPVRGREHGQILQKFSELKKKAPAPDKKRLLFSEMQVRVSQDCLSTLPFSCLSLCSPQT
ncbi:exocyst complex component 3-like protein 4 [Eucyclogobius newberryi]|uniref:exocyst complex component 3-like protein 4 n=1 Tax=Eucyclogobius newberryi TaxID=166745 RepID=UPI003B5CBC17